VQPLPGLHVSAGYEDVLLALGVLPSSPIQRETRHSGACMAVSVGMACSWPLSTPKPQSGSRMFVSVCMFRRAKVMTPLLQRPHHAAARPWCMRSQTCMLLPNMAFSWCTHSSST